MLSSVCRVASSVLGRTRCLVKDLTYALVVLRIVQMSLSCEYSFALQFIPSIRNGVAHAIELEICTRGVVSHCAQLSLALCAWKGGKLAVIFPTQCLFDARDGFGEEKLLSRHH